MENSLSDIAQQAAVIFERVGRPDYELAITAQRDRAGAECYFLTCYDPKQSSGLAHAFGNGPTPEKALSKLAACLGTSWPPPAVRYITGAQREELTQVLNDPRIERKEKTLVILRQNHYTEVEACTVIADHKRLVNQRAGHMVFPDVAAYSVVEVVEAQAA